MNETLAILEKVNNFYSDSFYQLLWFNGVMGAIVGIFVPLIFQHYQNRKNKQDKKELNNAIETKSDLIKEEIKKEIKKYTDDDWTKRKNDIDKELKKIDSTSRGFSFHLSGLSARDKKLYTKALEDYIISGINYIKASDELNLQAIINCINGCLEYLNKSQLEDSDKIKKQFDIFIKDLESLNTNYRYSTDIEKLKKNFNNALKRKDTIPTPAGEG